MSKRRIAKPGLATQIHLLVVLGALAGAVTAASLSPGLAAPVGAAWAELALAVAAWAAVGVLAFSLSRRIGGLFGGADARLDEVRNLVGRDARDLAALAHRRDK